MTIDGSYATIPVAIDLNSKHQNTTDIDHQYESRADYPIFFFATNDVNNTHTAPIQFFVKRLAQLGSTAPGVQYQMTSMEILCYISCYRVTKDDQDKFKIDFKGLIRPMSLCWQRLVILRHSDWKGTKLLGCMY